MFNSPHAFIHYKSLCLTLTKNLSDSIQQHDLSSIWLGYIESLLFTDALYL